MNDLCLNSHQMKLNASENGIVTQNANANVMAIVNVTANVRALAPLLSWALRANEISIYCENGHLASVICCLPGESDRESANVTAKLNICCGRHEELEFLTGTLSANVHSAGGYMMVETNDADEVSGVDRHGIAAGFETCCIVDSLHADACDSRRSYDLGDFGIWKHRGNKSENDLQKEIVLYRFDLQIAISFELVNRILLNSSPALEKTQRLEHSIGP